MTIDLSISMGIDENSLDVAFSTSDNVFGMYAVPESEVRKWADEMNRLARAGCPSVAPGTEASHLLQECLPILDNHDSELAEKVRIALGGLETP